MGQLNDQKRKILFVEGNQDGTIGGSHYCLLHFLKRIDTAKYEPMVMFYETNDLVEKFQEICPVLIYQKSRGLDIKQAFPILAKLEDTGKLTAPLSLPFVGAQKAYNTFHAFLYPIKDFIRIIRNHRFDLVHLNNAIGLNYECAIACSILRVPCISFQRGTQYPKIPRHVRYFSKCIKDVECVSDYIRTNLIKNGIDPRKCRTIYDGIDPDEFEKRISKSKKSVKSEFGIKENQPIVGIVGNLQPWKGQETVVDAIALLKKANPNVRCLLIGPAGSDEENLLFYNGLVNKTKEQNIGDNIIFTGYRQDVPDLLNILDVQIHASLHPDPFPHVILEGMSLGKAIVASNMGGATESIRDGKTGILIPPADPVALSETLDYLLKNPEVRRQMGEAAQRRVKENFHINLNVKQIEELYDSILGNGR